MVRKTHPTPRLLKRALLLNDVFPHFGFEILQHALDGLRRPGGEGAVGLVNMPGHLPESGDEIFFALAVFQALEQVLDIGQALAAVETVQLG